MSAGHSANGEPPPTQPDTPTTQDCVGRCTVTELRWGLVHCLRVPADPGARSADAGRGGVRWCQVDARDVDPSLESSVCESPRHPDAPAGAERDRAGKRVPNGAWAEESRHGRPVAKTNALAPT